jgi:hypothetical protein
LLYNSKLGGGLIFGTESEGVPTNKGLRKNYMDYPATSKGVSLDVGDEANNYVNFTRGSVEKGTYTLSGIGQRFGTNTLRSYFSDFVLGSGSSYMGMFPYGGSSVYKNGVATGSDKYHWTATPWSQTISVTSSNGKRNLTVQKNSVRGGMYTGFGYNTDLVANKYMTVARGVGSNTQSGQVVTSTSGTPGEGAWGIVQGYGSASSMGFYPEVSMTATVPNDNGEYVTSSVYVLGEKKRSVELSGLYGIKVGSSSEVKGEFASNMIAVDSAASALSKKIDSKGNLPVVYAGGDVKVKIESDFSIDLSGFVLDMVRESDGDVYESIVANASELDKELLYTWNTKYNYDVAGQFTKWVEDVKNDLEIKVSLDTSKGSGVEYTDFKVQGGKISGGEVGKSIAYPLLIQDGAVVQNQGYVDLIAKIGEEYGVKPAEAIEIFNKSGMWQSVASAVESSGDADNSSDKTTVTVNDVEHKDMPWYDEAVRVFVVRWYDVSPVTVSEIVVNDKVDYNSGPALDGNPLFTNGYRADWLVSVGFKDGDVAGIDKGSELLTGAKVEGASFIIPDATTSDTRR